MLCAQAAAILHTGWSTWGLVFYSSLLHWLIPWLWVHCLSCSCLLSQWIIQDSVNQSELCTELCNLPMESCTGKSFEALYLGLFVYSESIWRIILLKPKLLSHRLPKTKDISSSRVTAACAPDLPREASHALARPPPTLQCIRDCPSNLHTLTHSILPQ